MPVTEITLNDKRDLDNTIPPRGKVGTTLAALIALANSNEATLLDEVADQGVLAFADLDLSVNPTAGDTVVIGADTYEFVAAAGSVDDDGNIAVERAGSAAASLANLIAAVNATVAGDAHPTVFLDDGETPALANGTEAVVASDAGGGFMRIFPAVVPGGALLPGPKTLALSETLTDDGTWSPANLSAVTAAKAGGQKRVVRTQFAAGSAAQAFAVDFAVEGFDYTVRTSAGVTKVSGTGTLVESGGRFTFTPGNLGATDIVVVTIWG